MRAAKLQKRAARCGVETAAAPADIAAAAETAVSTADKAVAEQAVGELLFTAAALARQAGLTPSRRCRSAMPPSLQSMQAARKTRRAKK